MPYPKLKAESYENFGGINEKVSTYLTGKREFEKLTNFDLQKMGALTKSPGSTQYLSASTNVAVHGLCEFATNQYTAVTLQTGLTLYPSGQSFFIASTSFAVSNFAGGTFSSIFTYQGATQETGYFDFQVFQNTLFACSGMNFFKFNGTSSYLWGVPHTVSFAPAAFGWTTQAGGINGSVTVYYAFSNINGVVGPALSQDYSVNSITMGQANTSAVHLQVGTNSDIASGISFDPVPFGVTYKTVWASYNDGPIGQVLGPLTAGRFLATDPTAIVTEANLAIIDAGGLGATQPTSYFGVFNNFQSPVDTTSDPYKNPKYIALFQNQLWLAGMGAGINAQNYPSTLFYSDIGEPEVIQDESFFEVRTNNSDIISGLFPFENELLVFKYGSLHAVRGQDPDYYLVDKTLSYGCLSNRAVCSYRNVVWFLDEKGICEYNGANIQIVSDKMESTFQSMNIAAAKTEAIMIHVKDRFEVWCAIPINGSSVNNCIVIYDYNAGSWMKREGIDCSSLIVGQGSFNNPTPFFGSYSGMIKYVGASVVTDNSNGMTCIAKTHWDNELGNSVDKMYRRLFLDVEVQPGVTLPIDINFYTDHGSSIQLTRTMYMGLTFQNRIDLGLSAKSLSVEFVYNSSYPLRINGWTIEKRFQRAV